jgi:hypothetical protein
MAICHQLRRKTPLILYRVASGFRARLSAITDILETMRTADPKSWTPEPAGPSYIPVEGKTYSLFGSGLSNAQYYEQIRRVTDEILRRISDEEVLLALLRKVGGRKRLLARAARRESGTPISTVLRLLDPALSPYTRNVRAHLESIPLFSFTDRMLRTTEEQYHLYMLEIELANRLHLDRFLACDYRIALLPHCLRDLRTECGSAPGDLDTVCTGCSKTCFLHRVSSLLREAGIHPYIWRNAELGSLIRRLDCRGTIGVLGIACIPELAWGMRACMERKIPVVGLPLDANRCARWMGRFEETSVNMERLRDLLLE